MSLKPWCEIARLPKEVLRIIGGKRDMGIHYFIGSEG